MKYTHDVIVVGGGVNGTGVARDCALRGLKVVLFEKNDFAFGASGNNSGMMHGGARYLTSHPSVTEDACRDSGYFRNIAPNLVYRIVFLTPVGKKGLPGKIALRAYDAFFDWYDKFQPLKGGKPHTVLTPEQVKSLEPGFSGELSGAVTFDEWGVDALRLCALNVVDAEARGAQAYVHYEVDKFLVDEAGQEKTVYGVHARDLLSENEVTATAPIVINATGSWSPITSSLIPNVEVGVRPGKGIHVVLDRRISDYAVVAKTIDSRQIFLMPWQNLSWIGTTDDDFYGDLDNIRGTTDEVRYLLQAVEKVFPEVMNARVIGITVGTRPTVPEWGPYEDELSREHEIVNHKEKHGVAGLYSMIGGKLASYRVFAEEMSDVIARDLNIKEPCTTHSVPLPGNEALVHSSALATKLSLPEPVVSRLAYRHGTKATEIVQEGQQTLRGLEVVCSCEPVLECEVRHVCRNEHARTVGDVARRTRLGLGACGGMRCAHRAAQIVGDEHDWHPLEVHKDAARFLQDRYQNRAPGRFGAQVPQEELLVSSQLSSQGMGTNLAGAGGFLAASDDTECEELATAALKQFNTAEHEA